MQSLYWMGDETRKRLQKRVVATGVCVRGQSLNSFHDRVVVTDTGLIIHTRYITACLLRLAADNSDSNARLELRSRYVGLSAAVRGRSRHSLLIAPMGPGHGDYTHAAQANLAFRFTSIDQSSIASISYTGLRWERIYVTSVKWQV